MGIYLVSILILAQDRDTHNVVYSLKLFSEMSDNAYDDLNYISPELL